MRQALEIRNLEQRDLPSLLSLYRHLHADDEPPPARAEVERIWEGLLRDPAQIYLGAFSDGVLVAACNAAVIPNLTRGARPYAVVENVVTAPASRRRGIASRLLRALVERCWAADCYKIMLLSGVSRAAIHGLYEAVGFDRHSKQAFVMTRKRAPR